MEYKEFLSYIEEHILDSFYNNEEYFNAEVSIARVTKNNGVELDGINILKENEHLSPTIYLNSYFEDYNRGRSLENILCDIANKRLLGGESTKIEVGDIYDFEKIKDDIILRLVNYERNSDKLKDCPYKMYNDLAITFRWMVNHDDIGITTALISNREMDVWKVSVEKLYNIALENTKRLFPGEIIDMRDILGQYLGEDCLEEDENIMKQYDEGMAKLYVLTNEQRVNGASCLLYSELIREFAREADSNVYILPSSIHEVILILEKEMDDIDRFKAMVESANGTVVGRLDILSDSVYYYDLEKDIVKVA